MEGMQTWGSPVLVAEERAARFYAACEVSAAFIRARYPTALIGWGNRGLRTPTRSTVTPDQIARVQFEGLMAEGARVFRALHHMRRRLQDAVRALPPDARARARRELNALARRMKHAD